jgi:hypothetical protein
MLLTGLHWPWQNHNAAPLDHRRTVQSRSASWSNPGCPANDSPVLIVYLRLWLGHAFAKWLVAAERNE